MQMQDKGFIYHNIKLDDGVETNSNLKPLTETGFFVSMVEAINYFIKDTAGLTAMDLGCFEGGYTVELGRMGFKTVGIEARKTNIDKAYYLKNKLNLPINFVLDDVRNILNYDSVDVMLCSGLLYHLNNPVDMIKKMSRVTKKMLIITTHYALEKSFLYDLGLLNKSLLSPILKRLNIKYIHNYRLSGISYNEGCKGRWYKEYSKKASIQAIENAAPAAYNNDKSFWLCKEDLIVTLKKHFPFVYEQPVISNGFSEYDQNCMIVAIK